MNKPGTQHTQQVFSNKNIERMKQFFETYRADEKLSPLVRELPWTQFERTMPGNQKLSAVMRQLQANINQRLKTMRPSKKSFLVVERSRNDIEDQVNVTSTSLNDHAFLTPSFTSSHYIELVAIEKQGKRNN